MYRGNGRRAVVLLAEDDPGDRTLTQRALQEDVLSVDLRCVEDGEQAMEYLYRTGPYASDPPPRPDLLLLDINMPKLDGWQVIERVRADRKFHELPIVVLTTSRREEDIVRGYHLGCNSFISKPVDVGPFVAAVRKLGHYWFELVSLPVEASL